MARKPTGRPTGRPKIVIDWKSFEFGCQMQSTEEEICHWLKISKDTLLKHVKDHYGETFQDIYKKLSVDGKISLRRQQFKSAMAGSVPMQIWLGKQWLNQTEKAVLSSPGDKPLIPQLGNTFNVSNEDIKEALGHLAAAGVKPEGIIDSSKTD